MLHYLFPTFGECFCKISETYAVCAVVGEQIMQKALKLRDHLRQ
jgi:hypothetical protein